MKIYFTTDFDYDNLEVLPEHNEFTDEGETTEEESLEVLTRLREKCKRGKKRKQSEGRETHNSRRIVYHSVPQQYVNGYYEHLPIPE